MLHARVMIVALAVALAVAGLVSAPRANAWKYVFQDFFDVEKGAIGSAWAEAVKCKGDMLGTYHFVSRVEGSAGDTEVLHRVRADLPVTPKWRQLSDVDLRLQVPADFDPDVTAEILRGFGEFYDHMWVRWRPGRLVIRHPGVTIFGAEIVPPDEFKRKFKPKPGC